GSIPARAARRKELLPNAFGQHAEPLPQHREHGGVDTARWWTRDRENERFIERHARYARRIACRRCHILVRKRGYPRDAALHDERGAHRRVVSHHPRHPWLDRRAPRRLEQRSSPPIDLR